MWLVAYWCSGILFLVWLLAAAPTLPFFISDFSLIVPLNLILPRPWPAALLSTNESTTYSQRTERHTCFGGDCGGGQEFPEPLWALELTWIMVEVI